MPAFASTAVSEQRGLPLSAQPGGAQLTLYATEAGVSVRTALDLTLPTVELTDIRASRFFNASPQEFFEQYQNLFVVEHIELAPDCLERAVEFLADRPQARLSLAGTVSAQGLAQLDERCRQRGITLQCRRLGLPRAVRLSLTSETPLAVDLPCRLLVSGPRDQALAHAGALQPSRQPWAYWTDWFHRFVCDQAIAQLHIQDSERFFEFMKTLARMTACPLNWSVLARQSGISAPCARDWCSFLAQRGVIDLVPALPAPAPRRALLRPKLYWTAPGLALWLTDTPDDACPDRLSAVWENAVYLAFKDRFDAARWMYFRDTNHVGVPLVLCSPNRRTGLFFAADAAGHALAVRHYDSLVRAQILSDRAFMLFEGPSPAPGTTPFNYPERIEPAL